MERKEIEYLVDPEVWLKDTSGSPVLYSWENVIWEVPLTREFLTKLGNKGWIMITCHPYPVFYRVKEEE